MRVSPLLDPARAARALLGVALLVSCPLASDADELEALRGLSLEELMDLPVSTVSRVSESVEDAPGVVTVLGRAEIEAFDARTVGELLNKLTSTVFLSANVVTENLVSLRRQALSPYDTHVLVLLDGRPMRDPLTGGLNQSVYTVIPVSSLEAVEFVRGPGSVLHGSNAYSGVINLRTRAEGARSDQVRFEATTGAFGAFGKQAMARGTRDRAEFLVGFQHWREDGPDYAFTDYLGVDSTAAWRRETTGLVARAELPGLRASFYHGVYAPLALNAPDNAWMRRDSFGNGRVIGSFANLGSTRSLGGRGHLDLDLTWNARRWFTTDSDQIEEALSEADDLLLEATAHVEGGRGLRALVGATIQHGTWDGPSLGASSEEQGSAYAQLEKWWAGRFKLIAGAQWNKLEGVEPNLSPRLGLVWRPGRAWGTKLLYSEAYRSGSRFERVIQHPLFRGNPSLSPELIDTWEAQAFVRRDRLQASVTGYFSRMSDLIERVWVVDDTVPVFGGYLEHRNRGSHDFWGLEVEARGAWTDRWWLTGSLSWMGDETDDGRADFTLHARWMAKAGVAYRHPWFDASLFHAHFAEHGRVADFDPSVPSPNPEAGDHGLLSAKISTDLTRWTGRRGDERLLFSVWAENLLDEDVRYPEFTTRGINTLIPLRGGRAFYTSLRLSF